MLEHLAHALRALHIAAGATAPLTFAVPLVVAKGNAAHRRVGWIYTAAMYAAAATAVAIAPVRRHSAPWASGARRSFSPSSP